MYVEVLILHVYYKICTSKGKLKIYDFHLEENVMNTAVVLGSYGFEKTIFSTDERLSKTVIFCSKTKESSSSSVKKAGGSLSASKDKAE